MAAAKGFIVSVYDLDLAPVGERVLPLPIRVGRSSLNDVCVAHRLVSEFHARIEEVDNRLCVRDLSSKNGVLVETVGSDGATRVAAQTPIDLEPYGFEFLLSPLLRVRVRPATDPAALGLRHSHAVGSVLGNSRAGQFAIHPASSLAEDQLTEGFSPQAPGAGARGTPLASPAARVGAGRDATGRDGGSGGVARPSPLPAAYASVNVTAPGSILPPPTLPPLAGSHSPTSVPPRAARDAYGSDASARNAFNQTAQHGSPRKLSPASHPAPSPPLGVTPTASAPGVSPAVQPYSSVFIEAPAGSLELPPLPASARNGELASHPAPRDARQYPGSVDARQHAGFDARPQHAPVETRLSPPPPAARGTLLEPSAAPPPVQHEAPRLAHTAWEVGPGTLPAAALQAMRPAELPGRSIEALALRGLRELASSLVPGQSVETASDVVALITKLHDAVEMFCRCFIPVREACSRFIPTDELERAAIERCRHASSSYIAIERALEPRAVAAALIDWRNDDQDAPRAVEHILADLMLHHLALSQAALEGTRALLDELSPSRIDSQQPAPTPTMLSRLGLAATREKDLWEAFARRHAELEAVGRTFRALFGDQFTRAYLAQAPVPGSGPSL